MKGVRTWVAFSPHVIFTYSEGSEPLLYIQFFLLDSFFFFFPQNDVLAEAYVPCVTSHLSIFLQVRLLQCGPHIHGQLACVYATVSTGSGAQMPGFESRLYHILAV